jgi:hypothetical protein
LATEYLWYKCNDDAANTTVTDSGSASANAVTVSGNTSDFATTGKINGGFIFDGTADYFKLENVVTFDNTTGYSFSFWVKMTTDSGTRNDMLIAIADSDDTSNSREWYVYRNTTEQFAVNLDRSGNELQQITGATIFADTDWHHIVVNVPDDGTMELFVDGSSDGTLTITGGISDITGPHTFTAGTYWHNGVYGGIFGEATLDDIRVYAGDILTTAQIALLYNAGAGSESSLTDLENPPSAGGTPSQMLVGRMGLRL